MSTITLETIYKELLDLKKKVERLELLITLPEEELSDPTAWLQRRGIPADVPLLKFLSDSPGSLCLGLLDGIEI